MEKVFKRDINSLNDVFDFLESCISGSNLNESLGFTIKFAVEEVFTNMVKHNASGTDEISISLGAKAGDVVIELVDFGGLPFDITKAPPVDFELPIEDRNPGGLGIHLVKAMVDKVDYQRSDNKNRVTLTMKLR